MPLPKIPRFRHAVFAAALAAAGLCLTPVRAARLLPEGHEEATRPALWQRVWDGVPERLRPLRDVRLREVSDAEMDRLAREDPDEARREDEESSAVDGMFFEDRDGNPIITLRRSLSDRKAIRVFAHELGHVVWDTLLSRDEQRRYGAAYRASRDAGRLVSEYAGESQEEGFAESFGMFVREPDTLRKRDEAAYAALEALSASEKKDDR